MKHARPTPLVAFCLGVGIATCLAATSIALVAPAAQADAAGTPDSIPKTTTDGRQIYEHVCQGCHMPDAQGAVGAGRYPALARNATLASRQYMALTVVMGRRNMPAFGTNHAVSFGGPPPTLSDAQIASVVNYVRTHFGNRYKDTVTIAEVSALDRLTR